MKTSGLSRIAVLLLILSISPLGWASRGNSLADFRPGIYMGIQGGVGHLKDTANLPRQFIDEDKSGYENDLLIIDNICDSNVKKGNFSGRIFTGWNFTPYLSVEVGAGSYPVYKIMHSNTIDRLMVSTDDYRGIEDSDPLFPVETINKTKIKFRSYGYDLMLKGILPLELFHERLTGWRLYGKVGASVVVVRTKLVNRESETIFSVDGEKSNTIIYLGEGGKKTNTWLRPSYGLGIEYYFNKNFGVELGWIGIYTRNRKIVVKDDDDDAVTVSRAPAINSWTLGLVYKF